MNIEAMKQALEALRNTGPVSSEQYQKERKAIDALRAAIEQAEKQEPVDGMGMPLSCGKPLCSPGDHHPLCKMSRQPAAPVQDGNAFFKQFQTGLMDVQPAAPVQELAEYDAGLLNDYGGGNVEWWQDYIRYELGCAYEHYKEQLTTPPAAQRQWVGLTDEEVRNWWRIENGLEDCQLSKLNDFTLAVRAIEAKLREKNGGKA